MEPTSMASLMLKRMEKKSGLDIVLNTAHTLSGREHIIDLSIAYLSEHLNPNHFIRCHRSAIVAIEQIKAVGWTNDSVLELKNGMEVPLSRSNRPLVIERLTGQKA